jgi:hypothetical protein
MSPPAYSVSFAMILDAVKEPKQPTKNEQTWALSLERLYCRAGGDPFCDSTMMAQLLVLRSVEKVSMATNGMHHNILLNLFRIVVDFVGIARRHFNLQHCLLSWTPDEPLPPHLFPVPVASIHGGSSTTTEPL